MEFTGSAARGWGLRESAQEIDGRRRVVRLPTACARRLQTSSGMMARWGTKLILLGMALALVT
jgi:hypothetical protein